MILKIILFISIIITTFTADFEISMAKTLEFEGEKLFVDKLFNERSKFGITENILKAHIENMKVEDITKNQAKAIYRKEFWDKLKLDEVKDQDVANNIFDFSAHSGIGIATSELQKVINELVGAKVKVDGVLGSRTINELNKINKRDLIRKYKKTRLRYMREIDKKWEIYGKGWESRVNKL